MPPSSHLQDPARVCLPGNKESAAKPISVCLLISSLEFGGAERQVVEMIRTFDRRHVHPIVCSLSPEVPLASALPNGAEDLHIVERRARFDFTTVFRVASLFRRCKVDIVHAFLFDAEIVARLAAPLAGVRVVIASERNTDHKRSLLNRAALKVTRPLFDLMVANSNAGREFNIRSEGLDPARIEVVHNGVDTARFYPSPETGLAFRSCLRIPSDAPVVGMVASYKRQKGHDTFFKMAHLVRQSVPNAQFLIVGGPTRDREEGPQYTDEIHKLCSSLDLNDRSVFLGNQQDMNAVYNACDVTALLSRREGVANVILESMACGVPVVASDVGDNACIVADGQTGFVVSVGDHTLAAERVSKLLRMPELRHGFSTAGRIRVRSEFSLDRAAQKLERIYRESLARSLGN